MAFLARSASQIRSKVYGQHAAAAIGQEECADQAGQCVASLQEQQARLDAQVQNGRGSKVAHELRAKVVAVQGDAAEAASKETHQRHAPFA